MTHDILQSDIELATRLRDDHRSDDEIILALVHRGVELGPATQLVDDLRNGRKAAPPSTAHLEFTPARRSRAKSASRGTGQNRPEHPSQAEARREPSAQPAVPGRKHPAVLWRMAAVLVGLAVVVGTGIVLFQRSQANTRPQEQQPPKAAMPNVDSAPPTAPAQAAPAAQIASLTPLVLELQPDGLHLGGSLVTRDNVLTAVAGLLGVPTRTNRVVQTDTVIYAYDQQGLLIYSRKSGATNSIILDCEASGGIHGTTSPFTGTLTIDGQGIRAGTDPKALTAIKQLGLNHPGTHSGIWGGRYNGLELVFAYLKSPQRLSLIEIDLK
ncbi:MAG: hypothetical protein ABSD29_23585 [Verrucomicrobiota bacterium]|jgi:hypothetical protein